jgi:hypothetical protein
LRRSCDTPNFGSPDSRRTGLADYEIGEIKEGLEDAAKYDPMHDDLPIPDMIKSATDAPLEALQKAVDAKDSAQFAIAFDNLTKGCNACHASAKKEFIKIQRPTAPPATNQVFRPCEKKPGPVPSRGWWELRVAQSPVA